VNPSAGKVGKTDDTAFDTATLSLSIDRIASPLGSAVLSSRVELRVGRRTSRHRTRVNPESCSAWCTLGPERVRAMSLPRISLVKNELAGEELQPLE
jgi:hypothetical protein